MHMLLFGKKEATWPLQGPQSNMVIKSLEFILKILLEAFLLPTEVSVSHCKGHQKGSADMAQRDQAADQAAKRAALQDHDLIGVDTLVPQTNLPETPSYTEGETLNVKSKGFQDHMV